MPIIRTTGTGATGPRRRVRPREVASGEPEPPVAKPRGRKSPDAGRGGKLFFAGLKHEDLAVNKKTFKDFWKNFLEKEEVDSIWDLAIEERMNICDTYSHAYHNADTIMPSAKKSLSFMKNIQVGQSRVSDCMAGVVLATLSGKQDKQPVTGAIKALGTSFKKLFGDEWCRDGAAMVLDTKYHHLFCLGGRREEVLDTLDQITEYKDHSQLMMIPIKDEILYVFFPGHLVTEVEEY